MAFTVHLPFPAKLLWPNGSQGNPWSVSAVKRKHHQWAYDAAFEAVMKHGLPSLYGDKIRVTIDVFANRYGPLPDRDNCVAASKKYIDGIAGWLGLNDNVFATPVVRFKYPRDGHFEITIGALDDEDYDDADFAP